MGGSVNIAIRFRDGRTVCIERWTNNFPFWFINPKMYEGDEDYVQSYLDMTRNNDFNDPSSTGSPQPLRNNQYGLIVWDYMTNNILDNNIYSHPATLDAYTARFSHNEELMACLGANRIMDENNNKLSEVEVDAIIDVAKNGNTYPIFKIDTSPMIYNSFPYDTFKDFKAKLIELNFPMTKKAGLNTSIKLPKKRILNEHELLVRNVYYGRQVEDGFDRVLFDDLPKSDQDKYIKIATELAKHPDKLADFNISTFFGQTPFVIITD